MKTFAVAQDDTVARRAVLMRDQDAAEFVGQAAFDFGVPLYSVYGTCAY